MVGRGRVQSGSWVVGRGRVQSGSWVVGRGRVQSGSWVVGRGQKVCCVLGLNYSTQLCIPGGTLYVKFEFTTLSPGEPDKPGFNSEHSTFPLRRTLMYCTV